MATHDTATATNPATRGTDHTEGQVARGIEKQTAKLPSDIFLWVAIGTMAASAITLELIYW